MSSNGTWQTTATPPTVTYVRNPDWHDPAAKLIADKDTGKLLGAHFLGPQASTLVQQMITVMAFDLDVREVATNQYWIHPALPEVTENALLGLEF